MNEIISLLLNQDIRPFILGKILEVGLIITLILIIFFKLKSKNISSNLKIIFYIIMIFLTFSLFINILNDLLFFIKQYDLIERFLNENN